MADDSDGLCSVCANIDLKEYFRREIHVHRLERDIVGPSYEALELGYMGEIGQRSESCTFCRLIIEALCKRWAPPNWVTPRELLDQEREAGGQDKCFLFSYLYANNSGSNAVPVDSLSEERESQRTYRIGIGVSTQYDPRELRFIKGHWGDTQLSAISAAQYGMPSICHGKILDPERVNMDLARDWLSESLSYCWPKLNTFVTAKSMVTKLSIHGALRDSEERIIQFVQDAIQCVSELGERYLWVDAFCIIQDDEAHKSSQIQQMDLVYACSLLTLIDAAPDARARVEAHNGLVGYRKGSRIREQSTYHVQGMELLVPLCDLNAMLSFSRWTSRAWTYQEERLSKRRLYFTETKMYFQCSCAVFCEDSVGEGIGPSAFIFPVSNLWNLSGLYSSVQTHEKPSATWLSRTPIDDPVEAIAAYSRSVAQFSGRQMSNARDILASFEGILSVFRDALNTDFWSGLSEKYLDESLLWLEAGPSSRRNISITPSSKMTFPSWSWAGWHAAIELKPHLLYFHYICPEVEWFAISQSGEAIRLVTPGSYNPTLHTKVTLDNKNVRPPTELPNDFLKTMQHRTGTSGLRKQELLRFLACWTCIASFGISDAKRNTAPGLQPNWKLREHVPVLDNVGRWAGSLFMGQSWKENTKCDIGTLEFMLLSRSNNLDEHMVYHDMDVFPPREWRFLNVMLIQRDGDRAQRVGIGVIHEDAWVAANPVPMLIKLE